MDCGNPRCIRIGKWFRRSMGVVIVSILMMLIGLRIGHKLTLVGLGMFGASVVAELTCLLIAEVVHSRKYHITT